MSATAMYRLTHRRNSQHTPFVRGIVTKRQTLYRGNTVPARPFCGTFLTCGGARDGPVEPLVGGQVGQLAQQQRVAAPDHRVQRVVVDAVYFTLPNLAGRYLEPDLGQNGTCSIGRRIRNDPIIII